MFNTLLVELGYQVHRTGRPYHFPPLRLPPPDANWGMSLGFQVDQASNNPQTFSF
jgi:hypothetical protein